MAIARNQQESWSSVEHRILSSVAVRDEGFSMPGPDLVREGFARTDSPLTATKPPQATHYTDSV